MVHGQKFKDLLSSKCQVSVERIVLDLESEGPGSIPTGGNIFLKFYNPNLHSIARSDSLGFKTKNLNVLVMLDWVLPNKAKPGNSRKQKS